MAESRNDLLGELAADAALERRDFLVAATDQLRRFLEATEYAEDPPSRTRRFVSNVRVRSDGSEDLDVRSYVLLLRSRFDSPTFEIVCAERRDVLRRTPDGSHTFDPPIVFVLVSKIEEHEIGPPTFYMMEDKVSNRLFRQFAQARPEQIAGIEGMGTHVSLHALEGRDDDLPVFRVRVHEAYHFAEWLGGNLPTKEQWKKGAGFYNPGGRDGPFEKSQLSGIGVGRKYKVPLPVNRPGPRDVSCYGCRDMAGNGYEWIRDLAYWPGPAGPGTPAFLPLPPNKPPPENLNALRLGQTYTADEPLYFDDSPAWEGGQLEWGERYNGPALFDTSFRVVIEF